MASPLVVAVVEAVPGVLPAAVAEEVAVPFSFPNHRTFPAESIAVFAPAVIWQPPAM